MKRALMVAVMLAVSGGIGVHAFAAAPVTLPLTLGYYVHPTLPCNTTNTEGIEGPPGIVVATVGVLTKKTWGWDEDSPTKLNDITKVGANRYRIRSLNYDDEGGHWYYWEIWEVHSATSFTIVDGNFEQKSMQRPTPLPPASYRYCGSKAPS